MQETAIAELREQLYADEFSTARNAAVALAAYANSAAEQVVPLLFDVMCNGPKQASAQAEYSIAITGFFNPVVCQHWLTLMQRATSESRLHALSVLSYAEDLYYLDRPADSDEEYSSNIQPCVEPYHSLFRAAIDDPDQEACHLAASYFFDCITVERLQEFVELAANNDIGEVADRALTTFIATNASAILPQLWSFIRDPRPLLRRTILYSLSETPADSVGALFLYAANDPEQDVRVVALDLLHKVKISAATQVLIQALDDPSAEVRLAALSALGRKGDRSAVAAIRIALADSAIEIRYVAVQALGELNDFESIAFLLPLTHDPSPDVRVALVTTCINMKTPLVLPLLRETAQDEDTSIRELTIRAIAYIGSSELLPLLLELARDSAASVRMAVAEELNRILSLDNELANTLIEILVRDTDRAVSERIHQYLAKRQQL